MVRHLVEGDFTNEVKDLLSRMEPPAAAAEGRDRLEREIHEFKVHPGAPSLVEGLRRVGPE